MYFLIFLKENNSYYEQQIQLFWSCISSSMLHNDHRQLVSNEIFKFVIFKISASLWCPIFVHVWFLGEKWLRNAKIIRTCYQIQCLSFLIIIYFQHNSTTCSGSTTFIQEWDTLTLMLFWSYQLVVLRQ